MNGPAASCAAFSAAMLTSSCTSSASSVSCVCVMKGGNVK